MSGYEIYIFLEKNWLNYLQTVETLIRRHNLRVSDYNGLNTDGLFGLLADLNSFLSP